jgi:hypothetical protein
MQSFLKKICFGLKKSVGVLLLLGGFAKRCVNGMINGLYAHAATFPNWNQKFMKREYHAKERDFLEKNGR